MAETHPLIIAELADPDAPLGNCRWCGQFIDIVDGAHHSVYNRRYHRGDQNEHDDRDCRREYLQSYCWTARDAMTQIAIREHQGQVICVDCDTVCMELDDKGQLKHYHCSWVATHDVPLSQGGEHSLDNLSVRCEQCYNAKRKRENKAKKQMK